MMRGRNDGRHSRVKRGKEMTEFRICLTRVQQTKRLLKATLSDGGQEGKVSTNRGFEPIGLLNSHNGLRDADFSGPVLDFARLC
jgi:hypothetical protein